MTMPKRRLISGMGRLVALQSEHAVTDGLREVYGPAYPTVKFQVQPIFR